MGINPKFGRTAVTTVFTPGPRKPHELTENGWASRPEKHMTWEINAGKGRMSHFTSLRIFVLCESTSWGLDFRGRFSNFSVNRCKSLRCSFSSSARLKSIVPFGHSRYKCTRLLVREAEKPCSF